MSCPEEDEPEVRPKDWVMSSLKYWSSEEKM
jgi:hypothetical protein